MTFLEFPHVSSAFQNPHEVIKNTDKILILKCTISNVFIAECVAGIEEEVADLLKNLPVIRLQTSNKKLYQSLLPLFKFNYQCQQAVFSKSSEPSIKLEILHKQDLFFAGESYEMPEYINQLHQRNRLFGYYEKDVLIGYVAFHIDETVGALYVKPEFRHKGFGEKIMEAAFLLYKNSFPGKTIFAQILSDNLPSIGLHKKIGCQFSVPVYWLYNQEYTY